MKPPAKWQLEQKGMVDITVPFSLVCPAWPVHLEVQVF